MQFKPKLFLVREQVRTVDMDKSFKYLGRWYNFEMDNAEHKASIQLTNEILMKIDSLPLHPRNKILLYSRYLHAKFSWDLTVPDIDKTWIVNNIDNICRQIIKRWLEIPPSGTLDLILLSREKFGLEVPDVSTKLQQCQVTVRKCLRSSLNIDIQQLADMADAQTKQYDLEHQRSVERNTENSSRQFSSFHYYYYYYYHYSLVNHIYTLDIYSACVPAQCSGQFISNKKLEN